MHKSHKCTTSVFNSDTFFSRPYKRSRLCYSKLSMCLFVCRLSVTYVLWLNGAS